MVKAKKAPTLARFLNTQKCMNYPIYRWSFRTQFHKLWNISQPPDCFYLQGSEAGLQLLSKLPERGLAVVGTRNPHTQSLEHLKQWITQLRHSNLIILSGFARGIDGCAHQAALNAGIPTIAVLGAGFYSNYPSQHRQLRHQILESNGLLVSEYHPETEPRPHHFLKRNRILAGWSQATWVVQAAQPSGALNTAYWARELDRPCFAVPNYPGNPDFAGNQVLLDRDHALTFWGIHSLGSVWLELATC